MSRPLSTRITGSIALLGAIALFTAACAEGSAQPAGSSTGSGDGGSSGDGGASGQGGEGGRSSSKSSSSSKAATGSGSGSNSASGAGGGEGGTGPSSCGNLTCDPGESCASCPNDCTENCGAVCGDNFCTGSETCSTCPDDCEECSENCNNGVCDAGEAQTCPQDCQNPQSGSTLAGGGMCPPNPCEAGGSADPTCFDPCVIFICAIDSTCCEGGEWTADCASNTDLDFFGICMC